LFWWEGIDGTKVLTYRIQISYNDRGSVDERIEKILEGSKKQPMKSFMAYYGAGDHGGGATKENIKSINKLKSEKDAPQVFYSTNDKYFEDIRADTNLKIPVVNDDLQHHSVGCYTIESEIKKGNRQSETALVTAEKITAIGSVAWNAKYPKDELTTAWQRVLCLQFHDSLAGTSLFEHSQTAREGYGFALDTAHQATIMAMQKLEWQVAAVDPESQYVLVFNPHTWDVTGNFEYDFIWSSKHKSSRVEDEQGNSLPHQWTLGSSQAGSRKKLIVKTTIPAFGYRQIRLLDGDAFKINKDVTAKNNQLENEYLRVSFSDDGNIGIFDKTTGQELFDGGKTGCRAIIIDDPSDTWSHDVVSFSDEIGSFKSAEIKVLENGPLRAIVRVKTAYGNSFLTIDWILYSGSKNLKAKVSLDWHEQLKMLKFSFPVNVESPTSTYETAYGNIERAVNGDENPGQRWIDVTGKQNGKTYGLTVMNDAKYGYNVIDNDMRISIARAAVFAHHRPKKLDPSKEYLWMDQGIQTFEMLIVPHENSWRESNIVKTADEFSASFIPIYQGIHGGAMPKSGSFLSCDSENVLVSALKKAEDGDDLIIRCVETLGLTTDATVDLRFAGSKWTGSFSPYEIKTLRMDKSTGSIKEVSLLEE
ncbi:MAG: glycosyl hydrolase-related protein, partial [Draconibacterium sp.]|nr:glycosyl hydrolase-related protein [Draconibacterium sp.]